MDTTFVKFLILWMMCKSIELTMSMPSKEIVDADSHSRLKRTPGDFSLFGINLGSSLSAPFTRAKESFSSIGNILSPNHRNTYQYDQPLQAQRIVENDNKIQSIHITNKSGVTNTITQDGYQSNNNGQQQTRNQFDVPMTDRNQIMNYTNQNISERKDKITQYEPEPKNEVDKQLLNYIFQSEPDFDGTTTTVDPTFDFTTETGEYENTTMDELLRIPPQVVASLLG